MMAVETYVDRSSIDGVGVFARHPIKKGEVVWCDGYERAFTADEFNSMPDILKRYILRHGWQEIESGLYFLSIDNDQFMNHSDNANTVTLDNGTQVASRDIAAGEEITNNYYEFDLRVADKHIG